MFKQFVIGMAAIAAVSLETEKTHSSDITDLAYLMDAEYMMTEADLEKHHHEEQRLRKLNLAIKKMKKSIKNHSTKKVKKEKKPVKKEKVVHRRRSDPSTLHETRKSEHKDWPNHRHHFENNYKGLPAKLEDRASSFKKMMNNWNSNQYAQQESDPTDFARDFGY